MPLKDLNIERVYDTSYEDASESFFNPVLSEANLYRRASAYFSSSSFRIIATGLSSMLWGGGRIQLLIGNPKELSEDDFKAIASSNEKEHKEISKLFPSQEDLEKMMENENVRALALLLESGSLDIKFVLSKRAEGIFHVKFGIIEDSVGNGIAFAGSPNETMQGLAINVEVFNTFKSWEPGQVEYYWDYSSKFESYWHGGSIGYDLVLDIPEALKGVVLEAKRQYDKKHATAEGGLFHGTQPPLRSYQHLALEYWRNHGRIGMLEMATGTGKTKTALACIADLFEENGRVPVVIAVPTSDIAKQWSLEWHEAFGEYPKLYQSGSGSREDIIEYAGTLGSKAVLIGTYSFLSGEYFSSKVLPYLTNKSACLVADEAHHTASQDFRKVLDCAYKYRLGLSATPHRQFGDEENLVIDSFFGEDFFSYSLEEAIRDGYLSEYNYYPAFVELSYEEVNEYARLTKKIAKALAGKKPISSRANLEGNKGPLERFIFARTRIVKKTSAKYTELSSVLERMRDDSNLSKLMIFCEDSDQLGAVAGVLVRLGAIYGVISGETPSNQRTKIISAFSSGKVACIISMKVLDEGVDIGSAERAILMSSARDPRQYVQRAGRILRKFPGKPIAEIYDIIVYASPKKLGGDLEEAEKRIIKGELQRAAYFSKIARNSHDCIRRLETFGEKIHMDVWRILGHG